MVKKYTETAKSKWHSIWKATCCLPMAAGARGCGLLRVCEGLGEGSSEGGGGGRGRRHHQVGPVRLSTGTRGRGGNCEARACFVYSDTTPLRVYLVLLRAEITQEPARCQGRCCNSSLMCPLHWNKAVFSTREF